MDFLKLPRFEDGRINYHNTKERFSILCFIFKGDEVLLLKRENVGFYRGYWAGVCGYLDDPNFFKKFDLNVIKKVCLRELKEELNLNKKNIKEIYISKDPYLHFDNGIKWHIYGVLVFAKNFVPIINEEHSSYLWVSKEDAINFIKEKGCLKEIALDLLSKENNLKDFKKCSLK